MYSNSTTRACVKRFSYRCKKLQSPASCLRRGRMAACSAPQQLSRTDQASEECAGYGTHMLKQTVCHRPQACKHSTTSLHQPQMKWVVEEQQVDVADAELYRFVLYGTGSFPEKMQAFECMHVFNQLSQAFSPYKLPVDAMIARHPATYCELACTHCHSTSGLSCCTVLSHTDH